MHEQAVGESGIARREAALVSDHAALAGPGSRGDSGERRSRVGLRVRGQRQPHTIERVQTGLRMEKRLLKVLKGLAELKDVGLGDLLEGIVLHAFEGKAPFSKDTIKQIAALKQLYGLSLRASDSHRLREK